MTTDPHNEKTAPDPVKTKEAEGRALAQTLRGLANALQACLPGRVPGQSYPPSG